YAAGDGEFTFGLSSNIAFSNMKAQTPFATVAMVYRNRGQVRNKVFFVVYDKDGNLQNFAALDRHGFLFNQAHDEEKKKHNPPHNPPGEFGKPGAGVNLPIPSNCISCYGGFRYFDIPHAGENVLFLPFDLDQFDYEDVPGH